jgi:hypothetical protein
MPLDKPASWDIYDPTGEARASDSGTVFKPKRGIDFIRGNQAKARSALAGPAASSCTAVVDVAVNA